MAWQQFPDGSAWNPETGQFAIRSADGWQYTNQGDYNADGSHAMQNASSLDSIQPKYKSAMQQALEQMQGPRYDSWLLGKANELGLQGTDQQKIDAARQRIAEGQVEAINQSKQNSLMADWGGFMVAALPFAVAAGAGALGAAGAGGAGAGGAALGADAAAAAGAMGGQVTGGLTLADTLGGAWGAGLGGAGGFGEGALGSWDAVGGLTPSESASLGGGGLPNTYGASDLVNLASDGGDEVAWTSKDFTATPVDSDTTNSAFLNWLQGVSPDTWMRLGGTALNTAIGLGATNRAVDAQTQAGRDALGLQSAMYQQNRTDLEPWRNAGVGALNQINAQMPEFTRRFGMSDFQADPGYQFRVAEGEKAIDRAARARGLWDSGGTMKALTKFNSNIASQEYAPAYNRFTQDQTNAYNKLSNLAGLGQTSARTVADLGQNYANQASAIGLDAGNARAAGLIGGANTLAGGINQGMSIYGQSQYPWLRSYLG